MSTTLTTTSTSLGTSSLRGPSRQTRINPTRTSRHARPNLRQNSLLSNPASTSAQGAPVPEPHGFYPAITHFTDAITALPRDYRRNTSLLKEVDAKAWALEENLQKLLRDCLHERQTRSLTSIARTIAGSTSSVIGDLPAGSAADSTSGNLLDTASQYSGGSIDPDFLRKRRLYADLRNNLLQMIMPLDEKNHVINNANEELSRHTRRQDEIWPHISEEISEEARLGSLGHWALTDLNPTKKAQAAATRGRDAGNTILPDKDIAERSERRREAILAKKQKTTQQADSDIEARPTLRGKNMSAAKAREEELLNSRGSISGIASLKQPKAKASMAKFAEDLSARAIAGNREPAGGVTMSRENSQQGTSKKRKAPAAVNTVARKRINAAAQESPKLAHSPLIGSFGKEAHKKSPALSVVRPVNGRGRQSSAQVADSSTRPASSASRRNGINASTSEIEKVAASTGKTSHEVKHTMKETTNSRGEKFFEEDVPDSVDNRMRGGILLERTGSKSSQLKKSAQEETLGRRTASPRLTAAGLAEGVKSERNGKNKIKNATPVVTSFTEADANESAPEATSNTENGTDSNNKPKRLARPRMKDHHGLHDSLSPKGLPTKRMHKKNGSYSLAPAISTNRNPKDREEEAPSLDRKVSSRANSRSTKNNSQTDSAKEGRNASATPKIGGPMTEIVDEPDMIPPALEEPMFPTSRRQSQKTSTSHGGTSNFDLKPPTSSRTVIPSPSTKSSLADVGTGIVTPNKNSPLGSPGPEEDLDMPLSEIPMDVDQDVDEDDEEDDPNEARYCYCNGVSYGEMVACDNDSCAREWFHLECTGLRSLPAANSKWFCDECKGARVK